MDTCRLQLHSLTSDVFSKCGSLPLKPGIDHQGFLQEDEGGKKKPPFLQEKDLH